MTSYPKVTHSLVNVIIVILYLGCFMVTGAGALSEDDLPTEDDASNDHNTNHHDGIILPADPYPIVGTTLRLNCTVLPSYYKDKNKGHVDASAMNFKTKDKTPIPNSELHVLTNDTVQLIWKNVTEDQSGYVNCYMGEDYLISTDVNIGYTIRKKDVSPRSYCEDILEDASAFSVRIHECTNDIPACPKYMCCINHEGLKMKCTWCPRHDDYPLTNWELDWEIEAWKESGSCPEFESEAKRCTCLFGYGNNTDMHHMQIYTMHVKTVNDYGESTDTFIIDTNLIVKPNPVAKLAVTVLSSTSINVSWDRPRDLPSSVQVHYELAYTSEWECPDKCVHRVNGAGIDVRVVYTLTDLHPFTKYNISVRCVPEKGGYWSEKESREAKTEEAAPSAPPEVAEGSYRIDDPNCNTDTCSVTVMWKKIDKFHQNGIIRWYTMKIRGINTTIRADRYQATERLSKGQKYNVTLWGSTSKGDSPPSSVSVSITPKLKPQNVVAEINENKTHVDMWWQKPEREVIDSYTLFYCTGVRHDAVIVCDGDLESIRVSGTDTHGSLPFQEQYLYSIAANVGQLSSGMTEWMCLYHYSKDIPDVTFYVEDPKEERSLSIIITTEQRCDSINPIGRIVHYIVGIHCSQSNSSCPESNTTVIPSYSRRHTFENLEPNTDYDITLIGVGNTQVKTENATNRTKESAPDSPPVNVTIEDVGCHYIVISWLPPPRDDWNADSLKYHVKYKSGGDWVDAETTDTRLTLTKGIYGDIDYTINVTAATEVESLESVPAPSQKTHTSICAPSQMEKPTVDILNNSQVQMKWEHPEHPNGPLAGYYVVALYETIDGLPGNQSWNSSRENEPDKFTMVCPDDVGDYLVVNYTISAVSYDNSTKQYRYFRGPPSDPVSKQMCKPESVYDNLPLAIGVAIASFIVVVVVIVAFTCRQKWYPEFKQWLGGGVPEEPPIPDLEKPDDVSSYSTDRQYIDDWVQNLLFNLDSTPLIDENSKDTEKDDYNYYAPTNSGDSTGSRIFIPDFPQGTEKSGNSYVEGQEPTSSAGESEDVYRRGLPDTLDETAGLVGGDYYNIAVDVSDLGNSTYENKAFDDEKEERSSESSGVHSLKASDSDSKSSSCASSGIGPEPSPSTNNPLGSTGLFALMTAADLESDSEEDGYQQVGMTRKPSCPNEFSQFEDIPGQNEETLCCVSSSNIHELHDDSTETILPQQEIQTIEGAQVLTQISNHNSSHSEVLDSSLNDLNNRNSLVDAGVKVCTTCRKGHDSNIKCGSTSPQKKRQKRIDSSCSDESIPMGVLDASPSVNAKLQALPTFLNINSNATSC